MLSEPVITMSRAFDELVNVSRDKTATVSSISFEEYLHWAQISRADERYEDPSRNYVLFGRNIRRPRPSRSQQLQSESSTRYIEQPLRSHGSEARSNNECENNSPLTDKQCMADSSNLPKTTQTQESDPRQMTISNEEYVKASRAVRTASWSAVFYLLTMDILGPFSVPWAFAAVRCVHLLLHL